MLPFLIVCAVLLADAASKYWIDANLPLMLSFPYYPYGGIGVFKNWAGIQFSISHLVNRGAAWGSLSNYQGILVAVRILLIAGLIVYTVFFNKRSNWRIPLSLIIAGALGNVIDYYIYGHVVDMFYFVLWGYSFPVFNVADSAVTIGVFWLILLSSFQPQEENKGLL